MSEPAFPRPIGFRSFSGGEYSPSQVGMSLRDYFAAKAMAVYAFDPDLPREEIARMAYAQADAMIEARKEK